jgi:uncharacterized HAD superfamily protein
MRIALDIDGVMYKWSDTVRFLVDWYFGIKLGESTHFDYIKDTLVAMDRKDVWDWLWKEGIDLGLYRHGHLYKGAREAIIALDEEGHELSVITMRPKSALQDTIDWLSFHKFPISGIHVLSDTGKGAFKSRKSDIQPQADIYIDDSPQIAEDLMFNTNAFFVLMDRPWNQDINVGGGRSVRAYSWDDFVEIVRSENAEGR